MKFQDIYKPIPPVYNLVLGMLWRHSENIELDEAIVVHYCAAGAKPWRFTGQEENMEREDIKMLVGKWWDIYNDDSLDYKNVSVNLGQEEDVYKKQQTLTQFFTDLSEAGVLHYAKALSAAYTAL